MVSESRLLEEGGRSWSPSPGWPEGHAVVGEPGKSPALAAWTQTKSGKGGTAQFRCVSSHLVAPSRHQAAKQLSKRSSFSFPYEIFSLLRRCVWEVCVIEHGRFCVRLATKFLLFLNLYEDSSWLLFKKYIC